MWKCQSDKKIRTNAGFAAGMLGLPIVGVIVAIFLLSALDSAAQTTRKFTLVPHPSVPTFPGLDFDFAGFDDVTVEELDFNDIELEEEITVEQFKRKLLKIPDIMDGTKTRAEVFANPESSFSVEDVTTDSINFEQAQGELFQKVRDLPSGASLEIRSPQAVVGVRETEFLSSVEVGRTLVAVFEGEVEVANRYGDESLTVQSNELVVIEEDKPFPSSTTSFSEEDTVRMSITLVGGKHYVDGELHETEPYRFIAGVWNPDNGLEDVEEIRVAAPHHDEELILERRQADEGILYGFEKEVTYQEAPELAGDYTFTIEVAKDGTTEEYTADVEYTYEGFPEDCVAITAPEHSAEDVLLTPEFKWESVSGEYDFIALELSEVDSGEAVVKDGLAPDATSYKLEEENALDESVAYRLSMPLIREKREIDEKQLPFRFKYTMINATANRVDFTTTDTGATATYDVSFNLGDHGTRTGGGELEQTVEHGENAAAPSVGVEGGWIFEGWDTEFTDVTADLTSTAHYRIDGDLPDEWAQQIVDAAAPDDGIETVEDVDPNDDFSGNGWSNLQAFERGTDPTRYVLELHPGWNLASIALAPADYSVDAIFGNSIDKPVWYWDEVYSVAENCLPLAGHWVYSDAQKSIEIDLGTMAFPDSPDSDGDGFCDIVENDPGTNPDQYAIALQPGWNLVSLCRVPEDNTPEAIFGDVIILPAWQWKGGRYVTANQLKPLRGYWVYHLGNESITVEINLPQASPSP